LLNEIDATALLIRLQGAGYLHFIPFLQALFKAKCVFEDHVKASFSELMFQVEAQLFFHKRVTGPFHIERIVQAIHNALKINVLLVYWIGFGKHYKSLK